MRETNNHDWRHFDSAAGVRAINRQLSDAANAAVKKVTKTIGSPAGARPRFRHKILLLSFLLGVVAPVSLGVLYLYLIAADEYASKVGFTVHSEDMGSAGDLLGGLSMLTHSSSSDSEVIYAFVQSRTLVERINRKIDLAKVFSRPAFDPVFSYDTDGTIEDLVDYWQSMVKVSYASNSGLIEVETRAFTREDALAISKEIVAESTAVINEMSAIAREDATRYAKEELGIAIERLKKAREERTRFRSKTRIIDPAADVQGQMGLLTSLEQQLAQAYIDLNLTLETSSGDDPRISQSRRRIDVIQTLIEQEKSKFGMGTAESPEVESDEDYPTLMAEYERLSVDVEYANSAYVAAMASLDSANAQAQRQSRYLATYTTPSLAEASTYPERGVITLMMSVFLTLIWSICVLVYYSLRDRR
ncbi:capsular polysaccharide transport system permease protein [Rhodobacter viridis]|uniref:Capsular polysaccharide transport system permease protein n=2 Tax=Rhodobacter viridis TaxID=1054202 RepID=A0A318U147_9RHOB|nr:capsular polysaccharide transport system permease protein [Rhodobacter viridis]